MIIDDEIEALDLAHAESLIARVYERPRLRDMGMPFWFRQSVRGDERVNLARFQLSSHADIAVDFQGVMGVGHLHSGAYRATSNDVDVDPRMPFVLRPGEARSWSEGMNLTMVNLSLAELERVATGEEGTGRRLRFDGVAPVTVESARYWEAAVAHVRTLFVDADILRNDLIRQAAADLLLSVALEAFPIRFLGGSRNAGTVLPAAVRRAVAFIEDNAASPIGMTDIAQAARLSPRALQEAFQRHLGVSPTASVRRVRLVAAREDLLHADPTTTTVAAIARRWGFHHLGRFAGTYLAEYGEHPSRTLRT